MNGITSINTRDTEAFNSTSTHTIPFALYTTWVSTYTQQGYQRNLQVTIAAFVSDLRLDIQCGPEHILAGRNLFVEMSIIFLV